MITSNNQKWHFIIGRGSHPVLVLDLVRIGHTKYFGKILNLPFNINNLRRVKGNTYILTKDYQKIIKYLDNKLKNNFQQFYTYIKFFTEKHKQLAAYLENMNKLDTKKLSDKKLNQILKKFFDDYAQITIQFYLPFLVEDLLTAKLKKILLSKLKTIGKQDELEEYIFKLTQDTKGTLMQQEKRDLLKLTTLIKQDSKLRLLLITGKYSNIQQLLPSYKLGQKILNHHQKYFGLQTYLFNVREYKLKDIINNIRKYLRQDSIKLLKELNAANKHLRAKQKKIIKQLKLSQEQLKLFKLAQDYVYWRNVRVSQMGNFQCLTKKCLEQKAKKLNLSYNDLLNLTTDEILTGKFNKNELKQRQAGYIYLLQNGKQHIIIAKGRDKILNKKINQKYSKTKIIKGLSAYPGIIKGKVQIATPYTFHQLKQDRILVCKMTIVEAVPYLKRLKAIVTDEGGITCHAAIISRELKIPCIVGTKVATQVFEDGDMVEVNANHGWVRKIQK